MTHVDADTLGPNEWLVAELYQRYLADRDSVDPAWWDFFADYERAHHSSRRAPTTIPPVTATTAADQQPTTTNPPATAGGETEHISKTQRNTAPAAASASDRASAAGGQPSEKAAPTPQSDASGQDTYVPLRGPAARVVQNMDKSLAVPTATSVREIPAKLLIDNRIVINNHLRRSHGGKVSFTHLIGFALVEALRDMPQLNCSYQQDEAGKPLLVQHHDINLGLAIDLSKGDQRQLVVPNIKSCQQMEFAQFWKSYEEIVRRARSGNLSPDDFAGTTITLTNPGTLGTVHSVPRLMQGQGLIIGLGAMEYPAQYQGAAESTLANLAISKVMALTSTYDHRIIQGAQSGEFLGLVHHKLLGQDGFYDRIFAAFRVPYEPIRWVQDIAVSRDEDINKTARVQELINSYRVRGHLMADTDPLEYRQRRHPDVDITSHHLTLWDLDREFPTGGFTDRSVMKLRRILGVLRDSYCRRVGVEYMHIQDPAQREWIQQRVEVPMEKMSTAQQLSILRRLNAAEAFETFLQTKFVGQKRFSLEGGESVIPLLDALLNKAAEAKMDQACIGMPHRGRLNVLANIAGKSYGQIFREFEGTQDPNSVLGSGDVKYHLGTQGTFTATSGKTTKVYLAANPSHLEAVNPVLEGIVRGKQDRLAEEDREDRFAVLPILLHGDAAFAGQGVVAETLNLSQLPGYRTGGTIHVVVNNQVGFTTPPTASRSSVYCTDVSRMVQAPVFHVNGDDPESCVRVAQMAFEFRDQFHKDVVIDMVCYRRRGHNEGDDPSMTQPLMYRQIEAKRSVRKLYTEALVGRGDITVADAEKALQDFQSQLERVFTETVEMTKKAPTDNTNGDGDLKITPAAQVSCSLPDGYTTAISQQTLEHICSAQLAVPNGFTVHPKLMPLLERRAKMATDGDIDWGFGELLAFGSLLLEGTPIRIAGQDTRRGTFVQRHAVLIDRNTGAEWSPFAHLSPEQARLHIHDSLLSEFAVLGFEYGYSVERPEALVLWEAQFGDFANGAQTIIDEFVSSSEQKWAQNSALTMLLPHGYEGQGPDHSSARIERYLQLCAENNMTVAQPSTPASHFHLLRRQAHSKPRRPLIVITPKSMLRLKAAGSAPQDFTSGTFQPVLGESEHLDQVKRVLLCSGKVYWELVAQRARRKDPHTAIVRLEQLYPLDIPALAEALGPYPDAQLRWVQEEPANQGPWPFLAVHLPPHLAGRAVTPISRPASASPATGSAKQHAAENAILLDRAFAD